MEHWLGNETSPRGNPPFRGFNFDRTIDRDGIERVARLVNTRPRYLELRDITGSLGVSLCRISESRHFAFNLCCVRKVLQRSWTINRGEMYDSRANACENLSHSILLVRGTPLKSFPSSMVKNESGKKLLVKCDKFCSINRYLRNNEFLIFFDTDG